MDGKISSGSISNIVSTGYSSGWTGSYSFNNNPINYNVGSITSNQSTSSRAVPENVIMGPDIDDKVGDIKNPPKLKKDEDKSLQKALSTVLTDPIKNFLKDVGGIFDSKGLSFGFTTALNFAGGFLIELVSGLIEGKEFDFRKVASKYGGKACSSVVWSGTSLLITKQKGWEKAVVNIFFNESEISKEAWKRINPFSVDYKILNEYGLDPNKSIFKQIKGFRQLAKDSNGKSAWETFIDARKDIYDQVSDRMFGLTNGKAFMTTFKNLGGSMALSSIGDFAGSIIGSFFTGLLEGKSWKEALSNDNVHYGQEALKSVNKTVFATAGRILFSTVGLGKLGETVGSLVGGVINTAICEPFKDKDGNVQDGWCAIAAGAELGGAIVGGCIAAAIVAASSGPVGWVALGVVAGAAVCYFTVVTIHAFVESVDWEDISENFKRNLEEEGAIVAVAEAGKEIVSDLNDGYDNMSTGGKILITVICPVTILFAIF